MSLICNHYAEGNFEVLYNGSKQYVTNFWYTNKKDGEYLLPCGTIRKYKDNKEIEVIDSYGHIIYKDGVYTPRFINDVKK